MVRRQREIGHTQGMFRWIVVLSALAAMFPRWLAASDVCPALFQSLNARHLQLAGAPPDSPVTAQEGLRRLESDLFAALSECPRDAQLHALMGELQISLGEYPIAVAYGQKAIELDANAWRAWQLLGSSLAMIGRSREGVTALERAVELAPGNMALKVNLASALVADGQFPRALELCEAPVRSTDRALAGAAHHVRGQALARQGELQAAAREFNAAERLGFRARHSLVDVEPTRKPARSGEGEAR